MPYYPRWCTYWRVQRMPQQVVAPSQECRDVAKEFGPSFACEDCEAVLRLEMRNTTTLTKAGGTP